MRVAIVCPYAIDHFGGVQHQAEVLVDWLRAEGRDAFIVAPGRSGGPDGTIHLGSSIDVPGNKAVSPISLNPLVYRQVREAVEEADVVHVHEPLMPFTGWAGLASRPLVATVHASPSPLFQAMYRYGGPVIRRAFGRVNVLTAVSEAAAQPLRNAGMEPRVIPNGIDVATYQRHSRFGSVVFVGRDDPRKGLDVLLAAWPEVRRRHPGAVLNVVGTKRSPLPGVRFMGSASEPAKRRVLAEASILVAPNLGGESFGIVLAEGMASGCALVASRLEPFVRVAGDAARYFEPGDSNELAAILSDLLDSPEDVADLAAESDKVLKPFDRPNVLASYLKAYEDAVDLYREPL